MHLKVYNYWPPFIFHGIIVIVDKDLISNLPRDSTTFTLPANLKYNITGHYSLTSYLLQVRKLDQILVKFFGVNDMGVYDI